MDGLVRNHLQTMRQKRRKGFAVLVDPDKLDPAQCPELALSVAAAGAELILVGGSLLVNDAYKRVVPALRGAGIPVVLFPGHVSHIHPEADALLFLSLISGRNPDLLIGQHVIAAPHVRASGIEVVPTGYILVESGTTTTAHYMSQSAPIPRDKADIAACTALAGQYLGLGLIYMDAGSGAQHPIPPEMIREVSQTVDLPLVVGGGIRDVATAARSLEAGADLIVVGNALENPDNQQFLQDLGDLLRRYRETV